jgi:hypothetical protein
MRRPKHALSAAADGGLAEPFGFGTGWHSTVLVTKASRLRSIPLGVKAFLSSFPASPVKGTPVETSCFPGASPTMTYRTSSRPTPETEGRPASGQFSQRSSVTINRLLLLSALVFPDPFGPTMAVRAILDVHAFERSVVLNS